MENKKIDLTKQNLDEIIKMVNDGNADAMNELAWRYDNGEGVEKNEKKAFELFCNASEKNCIKAKYNLARCYYYGHGIEKNEEKAFNIFKELVEKYDHTKSYFYLGELYFFGGPVEIDYEKSFFYSNEALKRDSEYLLAKSAVAYAYYTGKGTKKNEEKAFNMYTELVEKNQFEDAYFYLGEIYYLGKYVQQDYEKSLLYFSEAIKYNRHTNSSKYYLGEMYLLGKGVNIDYEKAKKYFEEALDEKRDDAYYKLALMYSGNYGIDKNEEKAKEYFEKIELDLCTSLLYYILATSPLTEQFLEEFFEYLDLEIDVKKEVILQYFPVNHPARNYFNRLAHLTKEEFHNVVEKLKNKILKCKEKTYFNDMFFLVKHVECDDDVLALAKRIINV